LPTVLVVGDSSRRTLVSTNAGSIVHFPSNGDTAEGYLALPPGGRGPGVIVIQEWWGLVPQIKTTVDRFAAAGFIALAPDLYHGVQVPNDEPDDAAKEMMAMDIERAARDMAGAVDFLHEHVGVNGRGIGVIGFCVGGGLALWLGSLRPGVVSAIAPFYGLLPWPNAQPDYSKITAKVQGHYAENDDFAPPSGVEELNRTLSDAGVEAEFFITSGVGHAYFNETRPEAYNETAATIAWDRVTQFFHAELDPA
jgi:carboxymethylenebutenolidase